MQQLSWCYLKRAQLYANHGDIENEKKDLAASVKCYNLPEHQQPIPYEGDRAVLTKFMFYQPANQPQPDASISTSLAMKSEQ